MQVEAFEYTCNACGKQAIAKIGGDRVPGINGEAYEETSHGGHSAEFWACSRKCVGKAVANALDGLER